WVRKAHSAPLVQPRREESSRQGMSQEKQRTQECAPAASTSISSRPILLIESGRAQNRVTREALPGHTPERKRSDCWGRATSLNEGFGGSYSAFLFEADVTLKDGHGAEISATRSEV